MDVSFINNSLAPAVAFICATLISLFAIPIVVRVTSLKGLTDSPGFRKIHDKAIPTLGGVALFAGFMVGFLVAINGYMNGVTYFVLATLILFFAGMKDDLITLNPKKKLVAEIIAVLLLVYFTDIRITSFHGFLGISSIPVWATYLVTVFVMIVVINALNLIDGIDGLAAATGIVASVTLGIYFLVSGQTGFAIIAASLAGTLVGFIRFNLSDGKNKIFMGDTGSLLIGFVLAALVILFNQLHAGNYPVYHHLSSTPAITIAILIVPLFDTLRVFTVRLLRGQHPFKADNRHIHHLLLRMGCTHKSAVLRITLAHISIIALAFALDHIGILNLTLVLLTICLMLTGIIYSVIYMNYRSGKAVVRKEDYDTICLITWLHGRLSGKVIPIPIRTNNGIPGKIMPVTKVLVMKPGIEPIISDLAKEMRTKNEKSFTSHLPG